MSVKWSAFTAGSAIAGTDTTVGLQSSANVKWTFNQAATFFWASPTLVTPALGTPASGLLSSCTGLPLTTGITGTLGAANGGTGVANNASSTLTISGSFATTLTVTNTTGVTLPVSGTLATVGGNLGAATGTSLSVTSALTARSATATPVAASTVAALTFGSAALGIYWGTGDPTASAAKGSLYIKADGGGIADRLWINTNGTTGWTNFVTAA